MMRWYLIKNFIVFLRPAFSILVAFTEGDTFIARGLIHYVLLGLRMPHYIILNLADHRGAEEVLYQ